MKPLTIQEAEMVVKGIEGFDDFRSKCFYLIGAIEFIKIERGLVKTEKS